MFEIYFLEIWCQENDFENLVSEYILIIWCQNISWKYGVRIYFGNMVTIYFENMVPEYILKIR